ncbi:histidine kinase [Anaeromyxobacter sp. K]|uniref:sensor histidine kinase n=1 Tax=Anaeromyxobacter sp. (strain K) TaxID=447217 RepID=UPI00015F873E|nr:HAMP domain-containing sensor histidine kinase [Anaeromyxobacter sp. K]ACG71615.1 histidine kinase [Anaeromyxobacter sp. K]
MLHDFLTQHRAALVERARAKVAARRVPAASNDELALGVPAFLAQVIELLREEERAPAGAAARTSDAAANAAMGPSADRQGDAQLRAGLTVAQVVEGYGDVCQAIAEHAAETATPISVEEYRTLNLCIDVATSRAVTAFSAARDRRTESAEVERLGVLAHEMRNLLSKALLSYQALQRGAVGVDGATGKLLGGSLRELQALIDRSLSEVRLAAAIRNPERVSLAEFIEDMEVGATLAAKEKGLVLEVPAVDRAVAVVADRPLLASAVGNLLQNAIKFTPPGGRVTLSTGREAAGVLIHVADGCGGLAEGRAETMFRAFDRQASDHTGLGLGLKISHDAVKANGGALRVRDLPGIGCVFTVALPLGA